ncbi:MAG: response regulator [Nibricoccus sp.]
MFSRFLLTRVVRPSSHAAYVGVFLRCMTLAILLLSIFSGIPVAAQDDKISDGATPAKIVTSMREFWGTPIELRQVPQRLRIEIDIVYYDPEWKMIWGRCQGEGYYMSAGDRTFLFRAGQRILAEGPMIPTEGPSLANAQVTILGDTPPATPAVATDEIGNIAKFQKSVVSLEGYVQRLTRTDEHHVSVDILCNNILVNCVTPVSNQDITPNLVDSLVRVTGFYHAKTDASGQLAQLEMWVPRLSNYEPTGSIVDEPRFAKPPVTTVENLLHAPAGQPVLVRGVVHEFIAGKSVSVRDATGQVKILTRQTRYLSPGTTIEAVGLPSLVGTNWALSDGFYRIVSFAPGTQDSVDGVIRLAEQVLALNPELAATGQSVKIRGAVSWIRGSADYIYLQDATAGIRVNLPPKFKPSRGMMNSLMEVSGKTMRGNFAPEIVADQIVALGPSTLATPRPITLEHALTGVDESQLVELTGYLRAVKHEGNWSELSLTSATGEFVVRLPLYEEISKLVGSTVRATGVCVAQTNDRRELTGIALLASSQDDIKVEEPAPADLFDIPNRTISSLLLYSPIQAFNRRVRITGQVIHHAPGRYLHIQDGLSGMLVLSRGTDPLKPGDHVEISGLPGRDANRLVLREAVYRRLKPGAEPAPTPLPVSSRIIKDLDGQLVTVQGHVLESNHDKEENSLLLQNSATTFTARLENAKPLTTPTGAEIKITGVYQVDFDEYRQPRSFYIRLRTPADISILKNPAWWTTGRALLAVGLLLGVVLLSFTWLSILRRRVQQQTDRIREQLEKQAILEARHSDIVEHASDFIFTLDTTGRFTSFNSAGERITGYSRDEALSLNIRDLIAPDHAGEPLPIFGLQAELDGIVNFQTRFKTKDNRLIWIETNARVIRQHGQPPGILGVARDITDRKQIEEDLLRARDAAEANTRAKSAFLANMSHEIRTPMNGVIGMSNLLLNTRLSEEQRDFADAIRHSAESLLTVLNDILDFSKIEAGKLQFDTADFDLAETVEISLELLAARAAEKRIELASYLPHGLPRFLRGDPGRIGQVLVNLVGNAIKFTAHGEVTVAVAVENENEHDVRLLFEITDTGTGIDPSVLETLFQPFKQADSSTTRKFGGTGLGLAISKQIVNLMDGQIGVRSTLGKGSTFWFTIHLNKQPGRTNRNLTPAPSSPLASARILIVDDNATTRKILHQYTTGWNLRSEVATSAATALVLMRAAATAGDPYKLVLVDYRMPDVDGLQLIHEIQRDISLAESRLILLTTWDCRFSRDELTQHGVSRMLVKPVRQQDLYEALQKCMRYGSVSSAGLSRNPPSAFDTDPTEHTPYKTRPLRILVAEDNVVNQRVSRMQLKNLGHSVDIAAHGLEVLELIERNEYDVIFMDCQMPELDGYDTTRRIRKHATQSHLRIVAMTANAMQGDRERCIEAGMDDYVTKPTRPDDLANALQRCQDALDTHPPT